MSLKSNLPALTDRQQEILNYICNAINDEGYPPTLREIADRFGLNSTNGVNDHLVALEKKGYIRRGADKSRAIEILENPEGVVSSDDGKIIDLGVPIVGRIAAGTPFLATENIEGYLQVDRSLYQGAELFFLRIKGDSMIEDHIVEDDLVLIKRQTTADKGEIVAALVEDEATLKHFYPHVDHIELRPANSKMKSIKINPRDKAIQILGKMVGLFRKY
jgi:repressor LexA